MNSCFVEGGRYYAALNVAVSMAAAELQDEWKALRGGPVGVTQACYKEPGNNGHIFQHSYSFNSGRTSSGIYGNCSFAMEQLPSCCGMALLQVITAQSAAEKDLCIKTALLAARIAGYTVVQYTSIPQQELDKPLTRAGFKAVNTFSSVRTGSIITIWLKDLYEKPKAAEPKKERELVAA